ncbi:MAG: hypothetical protein ACTHKE_01320 [Sphingomicrobium sp.]
MAFTQLDPPIPLHVVGADGKSGGPGFAIAVIDYGQEFDLLCVVGMDEGGEIWCVPNPQVRLQANWSMGRRKKPHEVKSSPKIAAVAG